MGNKIRQLRFEQGQMTQSELATRVGVSRQTILSLEACRYSPSLELAFRIAQEFQLPLEEVFSYSPD
ncbi:MAG: helix-turn-helix transcriptional regulator [Porticoccaceae bacterium]|nr:helix-turn-helix transcriptional regulator [Porticoccaceae bacterium]